MRENNNEILESLSITIYLLFCGGGASFETGFYCTTPDGLKLKDDPPASVLNTGFRVVCHHAHPILFIINAWNIVLLL